MTDIKQMNRVRAPFWVREARTLELILLGVIVTAVLVQFVMAVVEWSPAGFLSAVVVTAGVAACYWWQPWVGLFLVAVSPLVAAATGWLPIHNWSIACFVGLLLTLRGSPGLVTGGVIGLVNLVGVGWYNGTFSPATDSEASIAAAAAVALAAVGSSMWSQRQYLVELERRSLDAIATRESAVNRSVAEERLRIARDLHDSVGHEIAVVSMHLGVAEVQLKANPDDASAALNAARTGVQSVLRETQEILQVLRVGEEAGSLAPTPDHSRVAGLVDSYREAGLEIDAQLSGFDHDLPRHTSTAVFRIVQEALTNAERHGQGLVSIRADITGQEAKIEVVNLVRADGQDTSGGGNGLVGMIERAESAGGHLAVSNDGRVFSVSARLPTGEEEK
jgi:signal transduction histidine kinase